MARLDGSGPRGLGPMTGRNMGYCAGNATERQAYGRTRSIGRGRRNARRPGMYGGMGRCMAGRFFERPMDRYYVEDAEYLLDSKESLEEEEKILEERLKDLNGELENFNDK